MLEYMVQAEPSPESFQ